MMSLYDMTFLFCLKELIENKGVGIFDILDEENKLPRATAEHFTAEVHKKNNNHYRISVNTAFMSHHFLIGCLYVTGKPQVLSFHLLGSQEVQAEVSP